MGAGRIPWIVLSTILLVLSTKYFLLSRKSIYMHAPLAVHACTKLGTTAQILQRTYRKVLCTYKKFLSGLREKRIALCEKWAMRFVEKACAFF